MTEQSKVINKLKKIIKSKLFWLLVIVVAGGSTYAALKPEPKPEYTITQVERQDLVQTVSVTGSVQGASELDLNFETVGILAKINVVKGDEVKAGDQLAQLSASSQYNSVLEAQANLQAAQATLQKMIAGASPEDILISQESANNAEITYNNKVNDLSKLESKLAADELSYKNEITNQQVDVVNSRSSAINTMTNELFKAEAALHRIKDILENDDAQDVLGAKNTVTKTTTQNSRSLGVSMVTEAKTKLAVAKLSLLDNDINTVLTESISALVQVNTALANTYEMLVDTPASLNYTQTEIDTDKTNVKSDQATLSTSITTIQNAKNSWDTEKAFLKTAESNLATFLASQDSQISTAQGAVASAKGAWDLAIAQLTQTKSAARSEDISLQRAQVAQAQAAVSRTQAILDQMTIYAPVDGLITKINYSVGEKTDLGKAVISLLGKSGLEIEVDIPESDIPKLALGQTTEITLDAFGDDAIFGGQVSFIDPAETIISDVVYYKVKVLFDQAREDIKPGMSANIDIITASRDNALVVPVRAVKNNGNKYVEVLVAGRVINKDVETGLRGDGGLVEIISGLQAGEEVITFTKEAN